MGGLLCVPEVVLYSSVVPPRSVPHPLNIKALHTIDNNNAIFMEQPPGDPSKRQWSETRKVICILRSRAVCLMLPAWTRQQLRL